MSTSDDEASDARIAAAVDRISREYVASDEPWVLGFSGGKDSSALLRLVFAALMKAPTRNRTVMVVYCDTGVEIPIVAQMTSRTLAGVAREAAGAGLPLEVQLATPRLEDRYFVKVIGRGYPPPTNKFRWCTDRLRINPVQAIVRGVLGGGPSTVLLGLRAGESVDRDRALLRHQTPRAYHFRQKGTLQTTVFAPILDLTLEDVWRTVVLWKEPVSLKGRDLWDLYGNASGEECPLIREPTSSPCGKGRFGCWTCTVVRSDQASTQLIAAGYDNLAPLLAFRDWLQDMRDRPVNRCARRRNGAPGPGPLTLAARRSALMRLRRAESKSGLTLLTEDEASLIRRLWREDRESERYLSIEG